MDGWEYSGSPLINWSPFLLNSNWWLFLIKFVMYELAITKIQERLSIDKISRAHLCVITSYYIRREHYKTSTMTESHLFYVFICGHTLFCSVVHTTGWTLVSRIIWSGPIIIVIERIPIRRSYLGGNEIKRIFGYYNIVSKFIKCRKFTMHKYYSWRLIANPLVWRYLSKSMS